MSRSGLFSRQISPGQMICPFLVSGVLEKDYTGQRTSKGFHDGLQESMEAAGRVFEKDPHYQEMDTFALAGMQGQWHFSRASSPQYADGHYFIMEKLALMPIYTILVSDRPQTITVRFNAGRMAAWVNGTSVVNNRDFFQRRTERVYVFEHVKHPRFEEAVLRLEAGENRLCVLVGAVGRGTGISFSMALTAAEDLVTARIPLSMPEALREEIAHSQLETYMVDDCWRLGEAPVLHVGRMPLEQARVTWQLTRSVPRRGAPTEERPLGTEIEIDRAETLLTSELSPGEYRVCVRWYLSDGSLLDSQEQAFGVVDTIAPRPGYARFAERRQEALERQAQEGDPLALYRLGAHEKITLALVERACDMIERRADCADFELQPLLWLVWEDQEARLLDEAVRERIRHAALGFRYWVDEPGPSSMFYCSENHRIGFHVCEYLAGLLYPTDTFTNCGQNGMYHSLKGRMHLMEWLDQRCRMGFDEPLSDSYLPVTLSALLVLREVLPMEEYPLRNMVNVLLDFMTYIFAVSSFDGVMATPRGRSYNRPLRTGLMSKIGGVFWQYFGNCAPNAKSMLSELAFSYYVPPKGLCDLAENFTPATFHYKQGLMHFDKHNADFTIRRTPDYAIGGARDHNVGMCDMHFISSMIVLRDDVLVFFSAPNNMAEGSGLRPDYWAGQAFLPRVLMTGRTLAVIWHGVNDPAIWMTHCHFNARKFDEVLTRDGWTFGRKGDGYVAIHSSKPHAVSTQGTYAGRELVCDDTEVVWLAECGSKDEDGSFARFVQRMATAARWQDGQGYHFASPGSGLVEFGLDDGFMVDKVEVPVAEYMALSPYLRTRYGSGRFTYDCPGFKTTQWSFPATE